MENLGNNKRWGINGQDNGNEGNKERCETIAKTVENLGHI
jgi:hypothetical protein